MLCAFISRAAAVYMHVIKWEHDDGQYIAWSHSAVVTVYRGCRTGDYIGGVTAYRIQRV